MLTVTNVHPEIYIKIVIRGFRASTLERTILQLIADRIFLQTKYQPSGLEGKIADIQSQIENYVLAIGSAKSPESLIASLRKLIN
jgi:hypothetical protein